MKLTKIGRIGRTKLCFIYLLLKLKGFNHSYYSPSRKGIVTLFTVHSNYLLIFDPLPTHQQHE